MEQIIINGERCERVQLSQVEKGRKFYLLKTSKKAYVKSFRFNWKYYGCHEYEGPNAYYSAFSKVVQMLPTKIVYAVI